MTATGACLFTTRDAFLVGSAWTEPSTDTRHTIVSPVTEEPVGSLPVAAPADVDAAVGAARRASDAGDWAALPPRERAAVLREVKARCEKEIERLVELSALELGSPAGQARNRHRLALTIFDDAIASALAVAEPQLRVDPATGRTALITAEPVGVVAAVCPYNGPFSMAVSKTVRALMAGCSVVLKPALEGALHAYVLADALASAGLPDGVVSVVPGGRAAGEHLVSHPDVDAVTFTGSTAAGRRIAAACGENLTRTSLELGGKSAAIILDDVDLDAALPWLVGGAFGNAGQVCIALTRIVAPRSRYDEVVERLALGAASLVPGDPLDPATTLPPLISRSHRDRVEGHVARALENGARLVTGGRRPPDQPRGWFYEPTLLADVTNDMPIAREEVFGPVAVVIPYDGPDEAVAIANDSPYGLHGAVFTEDVDRGLDVAARIRTGTLAVNGYGLLLSAPFGGVRGSGWGREGGPEGIADFVDLKSISLDDRAVEVYRKRTASSPEPSKGGASR